MTLVIVLIAINVVVFFLPHVIQFGGPGNSFQNLQMMGAKSNSDINDGEYYRLMTSTFLHADEIHLMMNMFSLWSVGQSVASIFGTMGFAIIYFLSGLGGSLASYRFNTSLSVGASGAIFGLVGALLAFSVFYGRWDIFSNLLAVIGFNFLYALMPQTRIDNFGHLGGLVAGFFIGFALLVLGFSNVRTV